jgi:hypothetical protein
MKNAKLKLVLAKYIPAARAAGVADKEFCEFVVSLFANGVLHEDAI